jgi:putative SOS response-associated peptidase YedK
MCGRFLNKLPAAEIARIFGTRNPLPNYPARFNIAPTDPVLAVRFNPETRERSLDAAALGLGAVLGQGSEDRLEDDQCPRRDGGDDARVPRCFPGAVLHHPASGFYEWKRTGATKQPYAIVPEDDQIFAFAGLWENGRDRADGPDAEWIRTCTIIAGEPNELVAPIHNRMPVILRREARPQWLGEGSTRKEARWHYVNLPIHPPAGTPAACDAARDCPRGQCVVAKIDEFAAVLRDKAAHDARERLEALKFVVHLVADFDQPLHASDDGDRGGNDVRVTFMGRQTNLHAIWNTGILFAAEIGDKRAYALQLARSIRPIDLDQWRDGSAATWATESNDIARRLIHGEWPHGPDALRASYEDLALPVVNEQLEKAGVKLAAVLR